MITAEEFKKDVLLWADRIGVEPKEIRFSDMKKEWGTCSSTGRLTFNVSVLEKPENTRLKVILHELLHLRYPNHGTMFNTVLKVYLEKGIGERK
jgi:predicted metal-dependent hydrolase